MRRLSDVSLRWKLFAAFGLVLLLFSAVSLAAYRTTLANVQAQAAVDETVRAISLADETRAALTDMETGYRGFLLVGRENFLDPYVVGRGAAANGLAALIAEASDPLQRARWQEIGERAARWQTEITEPRIALRRQAPEGAAPPPGLVEIVGRGDGKQHFDDIRVLITQAIADEERRLAERTAAAALANVRLLGTLVLGTLLGVVVGVVAAVLLARDVVGPTQRMAAVATRIANGELGQRVGLERRDELGQSAAAFDYMADRLEANINRLEQSESELLRQQAELERSNRELQDFASVASHDLQEPLRKVQAFGDRLVRRYGGDLPPEARDYLERMQAASARMQTLINDLLAFSRVNTQGRPFTEVPLDQVVRQVVADLEVRVQQADATVDIEPLPVVEADPIQMRQLFQNLIANGLKFARPEVPPVVRITSEAADDGMVRICVDDNGIGFDEKYLDRIFTIFQRLHSRDEYEGTGIGLAVCRRIVERHGGEITARSTPGQGSTFIFTLPTPTPAPEPAEPSPDERVVQEVF